ncbi:hypothetical protein [uncultured Parasphingopyxis sp.]|uniref:hypothetical protein n=1 Tax=uncultured Parasphingopyxis sp. TaxID=1547918 RepID=UPI00262B7C04|nr:hypothetical protein [uncultured Parasphingopyxis sp.]
MIEKLAWLVLAVLHAPPAAALAAPGLIARLYGVPPDNPAFALLHHRAALFLVIVLICVWAMFVPEVRKLATVTTALSMIAFLVIFMANGLPATLRSIAIADLIGLPVLGYVAWRAFSTG